MVVRQIYRVEVVDILHARELPKPCSVHIHFIDVVTVLQIAAHREDHFLRVKMYFWITYEPGPGFEKRGGLPGFRMKDLHGATGDKLSLVKFMLGGRKEIMRIMVVSLILSMRNEKDGMLHNSR